MLETGGDTTTVCRHSHKRTQPQPICRRVTRLAGWLPSPARLRSYEHGTLMAFARINGIVAVYAHTHTYAQQVVAAGCQALRIVSFMSTVLPGPAHHCLADAPTSTLPWPRHWWQHLVVNLGRQTSRSCGDLIFSSHITFILSFVICHTYYSKVPSPPPPSLAQDPPALHMHTCMRFLLASIRLAAVATVTGPARSKSLGLWGTGLSGVPGWRGV